jgi:phosphatidylserine decarboxylase
LHNYPHPVIAPRGWPVLGISIALALFVTSMAGIWSIPFWIISGCVLQSFRDPPGKIPTGPNAVLSPADGRVVVGEKALDPYVGREALKMSVFTNVFNVHSNRSPVDGRVQTVQYFPGKLLSADLNKASSKNERNALKITTSSGQLITCVQVAGLIARRILCYVKAGETMTRGQRYGSIRFGFRVDVYLPLNATPKVVVGDRVSATETILAELSSHQHQ